MKAIDFVHLSCHSEYSLFDSTIRHSALLKAAEKNNIPAIAMTDQCNLFGIIKFYKSALKAGIKPIIGTDLTIQLSDKTLTQLTLLAENNEGYHNIVNLISKAFLEAKERIYGVPIIPRKWLTKEGLIGTIGLSGGQKGEIGQLILKDHPNQAKKSLQFYQSIFNKDSFFIELQRINQENENLYLENALALAENYDVPVVATNSVRFLEKKDYDDHEIRVGISKGYTLLDENRQSEYTQAQYFKSADEMKALFSDIPEALENSVLIAKRCNVHFKLGHNVLPEFPIPKGMTINEYFSSVSYDGLEKRFEAVFNAMIDAGHFLNNDKKAEIKKDYKERLQVEIDVICQMGFPGYFLIVADFIQWAKDHDIPVGPGRGSGAGSLVAYALKITDIDPIPYELLFERFLNPERVSMPDFDIDFCMEGRDRVIEYVAQKYGRNSVSQIITFGSMAAKAVVRDVGRVLAQPYGFVDKIAKLIPNELGITLKDAYKEGSDLYQFCKENEEAEQILNYAFKLEGITRNVGKHAGGVVISPGDLTEFSPVFCEAGTNQLVSQFDKKDVEEVGLVKFDFLGLRNLTVIKMAVDLINLRLKKENKDFLKIESIPLKDHKTFALLKRAETTAVFQLESRGMKDLIARLKPDCFEDIIALVALFRPGPLGSGMVDDFINRKHGREAVTYPDDRLETVLKETYGTILYQEQVMQIAQILANYTLGGADILRRAMGKKDPKEMARQRDIFIQGAKENQIDEQKASAIFDLMEEFAKYGFNKSHSAAYALVSYQTAYLKAHFPAEFMAAVLSSDMDNTEKVVNLINECNNMKLELLLAHVNHSFPQFSVNDQNQVVYGLCAIKGVGLNAVEMIVAEREKNGKFKNMLDFLKRIDLQKANKRFLEALINSGALDDLGPNRNTMLLSLEALLRRVEQDKEAQSAGQDDLFGFSNQNDNTLNDSDIDHLFTQAEEWSLKERLQREKSALGLYLSGHLIDEAKPWINALKIEPLNRIATATRKESKRFAGVVISFVKKRTKRGQAFGILSLDDATSRIDMVLFSDIFETYKDRIEVDDTLIVEGEVDEDHYTGGLKINAKIIYTLDQALETYSSGAVVELNESYKEEDILEIKNRIYDKDGKKLRLNFNWQKDQILINWPIETSVKINRETLNLIESIDSVSSFKLLF